MSNFEIKRYRPRKESYFQPPCRMRLCGEGEWVKFDDIKEFLKPSDNTGSLKLLSDIRDYFTISDPVQSESEKEFIKRINEQLQASRPSAGA